MNNFSWNIPADLQARQSPMSHRGRRPNNIDMSETMVVNDDLAIGLFDGTYPGLKLASAIAYPAIFVPVAFMGLPVPKSVSNNPKMQELLTQAIMETAMVFQKLFMTRRIVGTAWVWPNWDTKRGIIVDEMIPNSSITDIIQDINTREIIEVIADEQLLVTVGENRTANVRRHRSWTRDRYKVTYTGDVPAGLVNRESRNTSGAMPIPFANDVLDNSIRGKSAFTRGLPHLKDFHDVALRWSEDLVTFRTKWVQGVKDVDSWLKSNQHLGNADEIDVASADFIMNLEGEESTEFMGMPAAMTTGYETRQKNNFMCWVESTGLPEMVWGISITGNHASAEESMTTLVNVVKDDRSQIGAPALEYFRARARLMAGASMQVIDDSDIEISWNDLDTVNQETRAKILQSFSDGVSKLMASGVSLQTVHALFRQTFPKATNADFDQWFQESNLSAKFKQFASASLTEALDVKGVSVDGTFA